MTSVADVLAIRNPTDEQRAATKDVVGIAYGWKRGDLNLEQVRHLCNGYDRNIALRCVGAGTAERAMLLRMIDALIEGERGYVMTEHGRFSVADLRGALARSVTDRNGHRVWQFPHAFTAGGDPIYRDIPDYVADEHERRRSHDRP
jgi:hypothetical protein